MTTTTKTVIIRVGDTLSYYYRGSRIDARITDACPYCSGPVVPLNDAQLAEQPDDTTHVCLPAYGGCNQGFSRRPLH